MYIEKDFDCQVMSNLVRIKLDHERFWGFGEGDVISNRSKEMKYHINTLLYYKFSLRAAFDQLCEINTKAFRTGFDQPFTCKLKTKESEKQRSHEYAEQTVCLSLARISKEGSNMSVPSFTTRLASGTHD